MRLDEAIDLAERVTRLIKPYCEKVVVAGSVRRRKPNPKDIDIVLIPKPLMLHRIVRALGEEGATVVIRGRKVNRLIFDGEQVDLNVATHETWAPLMLIKTGPMESNIKLSSIAKDQ